jgi:hypothetical protein
MLREDRPLTAKQAWVLSQMAEGLAQLPPELVDAFTAYLEHESEPATSVMLKAFLLAHLPRPDVTAN